MRIKEAKQHDLQSLLVLYSHLHDNSLPAMNAHIQRLWARILEDSDHHLLLGVEAGEVVSSCVLIVIPNLTHNQRPYALVENVITHPDYRGRGFATQLLSRAREIAEEENCYKIMLLTGSKKESTLRFYERAGYNRQDKTAFIQWL